VNLRLRYSLRGFLLAVAVCAVGTSWFAVEFLQRYRREAAVLNHLSATGCDVQLVPRSPRWFWQWFGDEIALQASSLDLSHMPIGDAELIQIAALSGLQGLYLNDTNVTDAGVAHLAGRTDLVALSLRNTAVRRAPPLAGMSKLLHLDLSNSAIEVWHAVDLQSLEYLGLAGTRIGDRSLAAFGPLPNLQTLDVERNASITDVGIAQLNRARLPRLTRIYVWKTSVTDAGASALSAEFPGAAIYRSPEAIPVGDSPVMLNSEQTATKGH
jgi:hypothetical protein